jgi:7-cyano-7-deazaguanine synthase
MDSIALAFWKLPDIAITVHYGQKAAEAEVRAAAQVSVELGMRHEVVRVDCSALGSGDMAGGPALAAAPVPEWWPYRNQMLITFAAMRGIALGVSELILGSVASDGSHADGRSQFYEAMDAVLVQQEGGMRVTAPALHLTTAGLVRLSGVPRPLLSWAHSCHVGNLACGACRGCVKHYQVTDEIFGDAY